MNIIKVSGTKPERIIGGKKYIRQEKTMMALRDFNSYVDSNFNSYDYFIKKTYDDLTRGLDMDKEGYTVFAEIIRKGKNRALYLTLFKIDRDHQVKSYNDMLAEKKMQEAAEKAQKIESIDENDGE